MKSIYFYVYLLQLSCTKNSASRGPTFNPSSPPFPHLFILPSPTSISNPYTTSLHLPHLTPSILTSSLSHSPFLFITQNPWSPREIQRRVGVHRDVLKEDGVEEKREWYERAARTSAKDRGRERKGEKRAEKVKKLVRKE